MTKPARRLARACDRSRSKKSSAPARSKLTIKQRKFLNGKLKGQSSAQAAREAGYSESVARKADHIISNSPSVSAALDEILAIAGISDELLATRIYEGLSATIVLRGTAHAERELLTDFGERREMVELILRLKGYLIDKHNVRVGPTLEELLHESYQ
jgi:hypothetical protein